MVKIIGYIDNDGTFHEEERTTPVTTNSIKKIPTTAPSVAQVSKPKTVSVEPTVKSTMTEAPAMSVVAENNKTAKQEEPKTNGVINADGYEETDKKYGDYKYHDYLNKKDYKIYKKDGKSYYYDEKRNRYVDMDESIMISPEEDKKQHEEAIRNGFVDNNEKKPTKMADQVALDTSDLTDKEKEKYTKSLIRQEKKKDKDISYVRRGGAGISGFVGELKNAGKNIDEGVIEPISRAPASYQYGKLNQELSQAYYNQMMGNNNEDNVAEIQHKIDLFNQFNRDVVEPQNINKYNTIYNNLVLRGVPEKEAEKEAKKVLKTNQLDEYFKNLPNQVSGMVEGVKGAGVGGTIGAIGGGTIGFLTTKDPSTALLMAEKGAKLLGGSGYVAGQAKNTFELEAGAEYQALLEMGVPEDIAKTEALKVGTANALVESGESILDLVTLGKSSLAMDKLKEGLIKKYGLEALKSWGVSYATNVASEAGEEAIQEGISIQGEKNAAKKAGIKRDNSQDLNRIVQSAKSGGFSALLSGGATRTFGIAGNTAKNTMVNQINNSIQNKNNNFAMSNVSANQNQINNQTNKIINNNQNIQETNSSLKLKEDNNISVSDENMPKFRRLFKNAFDRFGKIKSFKQQISDYENNKLTPGEQLLVSPNSEFLSYSGIKNVPIIESQTDLSKDLTGIHSDSVPREVVENLPEELKNAVLALDSRTNDNAKVYILDAKNSDGVPIIATIHQNRNISKIEVNALTSVYEKNDLQSFINRTIDEKKSVFSNKKTNEWLVREGLQLPDRYTNNSLVYGNNISQNSTNVNENNITPQTQKSGTITLDEIGQMGQDYFDDVDNKIKQDGTSDSSFSNEQNKNQKLENRVNGDRLLDAQDLINEIKNVGADVDDNGYVTVYHQTTPENAQKILDTGKMTSKEQAVFFSTSKYATQSEGRGTTKLEFKIPAEELELDDIFSDNADVKINLNGKKDIDVSNYLTNNNKAETIQEPVIQAKPEPNFEDIDNKINGDKEVKVLESVPKETKKPLKERARETVKKFTRDFISKGEAVENLARKQKNPALNHQFDRLGIVRGESQEHIGTMQRDLDLKPRKNFTDANGKKSTMSLNGIRGDAKTHGIPEATLNRYIAEYRNVDTAKQGKPILNKSAEASLEVIQKIESEHPEIKRIAGNVWTFERNQLQDRVQSGLISEQFAKELLEKNPHYARVQRDVKGKKTTNTLNDTKRGVEVNRQIDTLKGSDADILPIMESIAKYTEQVQQSMRMNQFGQELAKTLGVGTEDSSISSFTDEESFGVNPNLLQDDGNGNYTLTVFNDGVATVVPIDQGLYESLTPNKTVQTLENDETFKKITYAPKKISEMFRAVTTNQNPIFMFTNAFKDIGDAPFNSKYTGEFIKAYTSTQALRQVAGNGVYNQLYEAAGGKQNSYFNNGEFVDKTQSKTSKIKDKLLMPIEKGNDIVESVPRMAEFIATIKANGYEVNADGELVVKNKSKATKSANDVLNEALYNAAEVTTNFKRGGDVAKMLNRNGATFLNASIQGFDKQVRNFTQIQTPKEAAMLLTKALIFGIAPTMLNDAMWDDDDEYEELQDYLKDNYYLFKGKDGQWIRIPKGRAMSVIGGAFRRAKNYAKGDKDAFKDFGSFASSQIAPNNPFENNIISPIVDVSRNESWSGNKIIPTAYEKKKAEKQYNEKTDKVSRKISEEINKSELAKKVIPKNFRSAMGINYLIDQYSGAIGDMTLPYMTPKVSTKNRNPVSAPFLDKFTTDSVYSNKSVNSFYDTMNRLAEEDETPIDVAKNNYMTSKSIALSKLYKEQRNIQNDDTLSKDEKYEKAREIQKEINKFTKDTVKNINNIEQEEYYLKIGDDYYKRVIKDGEEKYIKDGSKKIPTDKYALYDYFKEKYEKSKEEKK